jgi:tetratricopeptide (TPR) repeat protein/S1-C subfamily serine protease
MMKPHVCLALGISLSAGLLMTAALAQMKKFPLQSPTRVTTSQRPSQQQLIAQSIEADTKDTQQTRPAYSGVVAQVDAIAQQVTVRIDSRFSGSGSGVIVAKNGQTYYVVTANHVVDQDSSQPGCQLNASKGPEVYTVKAPDAQRYSVQSAKLACLDGVDLAVVPFSSQATYAVATVGTYNPDQSDIVFVSGFPSQNSHPNTTDQRQLTAGMLQKQDETDFKVKDRASLANGYELVYSAQSYAGMSGGPVLNSKGDLIGINTAAENEIVVKAGQEAEISLGYSLGVPIRTFMGLLDRVKIEPGWLKVENSIPAPLSKAERASVKAQLFEAQPPSAQGSAPDWLNYGSALLRLGEEAQAITAFDRAIQLQPNFVQAYYAKGLALRSAKNYREAVSAFEQVNRLEPGFYQAWRYRGLVLFLGLKQYPEALASIEQAIKIEPHDLALLMEKGLLLTQLERYSDAVAAYTAAMAIKPHPWAYTNRGAAYSGLKDYPKAIADYNQALTIQPNDVPAFTNRGAAYRDLKEYSKAIADLNKAIAINPKFGLAYNIRGTVYRALNDYPKAIADYQNAISIDSKDPHPYTNRGNVLFDLKQYAKSIADHSQSIALDPKLANAYNNRGNAYRAMNEHSKAMSDFNQAIMLDPKLANAYNNRGHAHLGLKDYSQAIKDFSQAIALDSGLVQSYKGRGHAYLRLKDYPQAITNYSKAIVLDPDHPEIYTIRGAAYADLKDYSKAIVDWQKAATLFQQQGRVKDAQAVRSILQDLQKRQRT